MASILIVPVPEHGHISPTLPVASSLSASGHTVTYFTDHQFERVIHQAGCRLIPLMQNRPGPLQASGDHIWNAFAPRTGVGLRANRLRGLVHDAVGRIRPDLILFDRHVVSNPRFPMTAFAHPQRHLTYSTSIPNWTETLDPSPETPMLVFCPEVFEVERCRRPPREVQYVEASIYNQTATEQEERPGDRDKPLVLATFGTQTIKYPHLDAQLELIYQVAQRLPGLDFVVATGAPASIVNTRSEHPPNLFLRSFIPQQAWMKHASVFIGHGGLGGIKEAIVEGVPMIVLPFIQDQPYNAMRVRTLGLGTALFPEKQTVNALENDLTRVVSGAFTRNLLSMQQSFLKLESEKPSLAIISERLQL